MGLNDEITARRSEVRSDGYPMSIGEFINMYRDEELDIHPEFQRFYRWSLEQKSRLIESILLGIPIPSIFVSQREDAVWDVIDGLQRLSTIFEFFGILKNSKGNILDPLELKGTKYLPSLENMKWDGDDSENGIGSVNRLIIRRSKIDVKIILRESSEASKFELFQRLNTGGSQLSDQELRNAILTMVNSDAYRWIRRLSQDPNFQACTPLTDRAKSQQYDMELVTRFILFRLLPSKRLNAVGDLGEFLTENIVSLAESSDFDEVLVGEQKAFEFTFQTLAKTLGEDSFKKYDLERERFLGPFLISAFEPIAMGLGYNFEKYNRRKSNLPDISDISKRLWSNKRFCGKQWSRCSCINSNSGYYYGLEGSCLLHENPFAL